MISWLIIFIFLKKIIFLDNMMIYYWMTQDTHHGTTLTNNFLRGRPIQNVIGMMHR